MLCSGSFGRLCVVVVFVLGLSFLCGFPRLFWRSFFSGSSLRTFAMRRLEREFVVPFVRFVDDLVQVFRGESLLGGGCCVCARVSEVVRGPISRVDHVCLFVEVFRCGGKCLCPHVS